MCPNDAPKNDEATAEGEVLGGSVGSKSPVSEVSSEDECAEKSEDGDNTHKSESVDEYVDDSSNAENPVDESDEEIEDFDEEMDAESNICEVLEIDNGNEEEEDDDRTEDEEVLEEVEDIEDDDDKEVDSQEKEQLPAENKQESLDNTAKISQDNQPPDYGNLRRFSMPSGASARHSLPHILRRPLATFSAAEFSPENLSDEDEEEESSPRGTEDLNKFFLSQRKRLQRSKEKLCSANDKIKKLLEKYDSEKLSRLQLEEQLAVQSSSRRIESEKASHLANEVRHRDLEIEKLKHSAVAVEKRLGDALNDCQAKEFENKKLKIEIQNERSSHEGMISQMKGQLESYAEQNGKINAILFDERQQRDRERSLHELRVGNLEENFKLAEANWHDSAKQIQILTNDIKTSNELVKDKMEQLAECQQLLEVRENELEQHKQMIATIELNREDMTSPEHQIKEHQEDNYISNFSRSLQQTPQRQSEAQMSYRLLDELENSHTQLKQSRRTIANISSELATVKRNSLVSRRSAEESFQISQLADTSAQLSIITDRLNEVEDEKLCIESSLIRANERVTILEAHTKTQDSSLAQLVYVNSLLAKEANIDPRTFFSSDDVTHEVWSDVKSLVEENSKLLLEIEELKKRHEEEQNLKLHSLAEEVVKLEFSKKELEEAKDHLISSLERRLSDAKTREEKIRDDLENSRKEALSFSSLLRKENDSPNNVEKRNLENRIQILKSSLEDITKQRDAERLEASTLRSQLAIAEGSTAFFKSEAQSASQRAEALIVERQSTDIKLSSLTDEVRKLENTNSELQNETKIQKRMLSMKEEEYENALRDRRNAEAELELAKVTLSQTSETFTERLIYAQSEAEYWGAEVRRLQEDLVAQTKRAKDDNQEFQRRLAELVLKQQDDERRIYLAEKQSSAILEQTQQKFDRLTKLEKQNSVLTEQLEAKEKELQILKISPPSVIRAQARAERIVMGKDLEDSTTLFNEREFYRQKWQETEEAFELLKKELQDAQDLQSKWRCLASSLEQEVDSRVQEIENCQRESEIHVTSLKEQISQLLLNADIFRSELESYKMKMWESQNRSLLSDQSATVELCKMKEKLQTLEIEKDRFRLDLLTSETSLSSLREMLKMSMDEVNSVGETNKNLKEEIRSNRDDSMKRIRELESRITELQSELSGTEGLLYNERTKTEKMREENTRLQLEISANKSLLDKQMDSLDADVELKRQVTQWKRHSSILQNQLEVSKGEVTHLQLQKNHLEVEHKSTSEKLQDLEQKLQEQEANPSLPQDIKDSLADSFALKLQCERQRTEISSLRNEIAIQSEKIANEGKRNYPLREQIQQLMYQLEKKSEEASNAWACQSKSEERLARAMTKVEAFDDLNARLEEQVNMVAELKEANVKLDVLVKELNVQIDKEKSQTTASVKQLKTAQDETLRANEESSECRKKMENYSRALAKARESLSQRPTVLPKKPIGTQSEGTFPARKRRALEISAGISEAIPPETSPEDVAMQGNLVLKITKIAVESQCIASAAVNQLQAPDDPPAQAPDAPSTTEELATETQQEKLDSEEMEDGEMTDSL
eukprot:GHVP01028329.1.p1 GENE.GHVP01028329.1~~GHVP01028329.1.p1  ORF type:complete len:1578 (+),score=427.47 GHVP01028329.1:342-5075(+)